MDKLPEIINEELKELTKRRMYTFGSILFYSDARLADLNEKHRKNMTLEEGLSFYKQVNAEFKSKKDEYEQHNADVQAIIDNNNQLRKELLSKNDIISKLNDQIAKKEAEAKDKKSAYNNAAELTKFYQEKANDAAKFPTDLKNVCDWASEQFSKNFIISPEAKKAVTKYNHLVDTAVLCDALYYLNAYAEYRLSNIDEQKLVFYAHSYNWKVGFSGKKTVTDFKKDYTVTVDGKKYTLDLHVKDGNDVHLVRVYFAWDDELKKIIMILSILLYTFSQK